LQDGAWASGVSVPTNFTLIALPPKCPEPNPAENIWKLIRDNWLFNRIFTSYEDILDHCYRAWNKLIAHPWRIMSISLEDSGHA
jgi:transposase